MNAGCEIESLFASATKKFAAGTDDMSLIEDEPQDGRERLCLKKASLSVPCNGLQFPQDPKQRHRLYVLPLKAHSGGYKSKTSNPLFKRHALKHPRAHEMVRGLTDTEVEARAKDGCSNPNSDKELHKVAQS